MICVRCLRDKAYKVADAPDGTKAWEMYHCKNCNYSWRNSDPDYITDPKKRDPWAQLDHHPDEKFKDMGVLWEFVTFKENPTRKK